MDALKRRSEGSLPRAGGTERGPQGAAGCKASLQLLYHSELPGHSPTFSRVYVARSMISGKCSSYSRMTSFIMSAGGERGGESTWTELGPKSCSSPSVSPVEGSTVGTPPHPRTVQME